MAYSNREKIIGTLRSPARPSTVIDFIPYEFSDRILGFYTGSPLKSGSHMYWRVQNQDIPVQLLACEVSQGTSGFRARMATEDDETLVTNLLDIDSNSGQLKYLRADNDMQAVRFQPPLYAWVEASTFGAQDTFRFDCLNFSKTGLLLAANRASERAPFIEGTLLEMCLHFHSELIQYPIKLMGKVVRVDELRRSHQVLQPKQKFFGVHLLANLDANPNAPTWTQTLSQIEGYYLRSVSQSQAA